MGKKWRKWQPEHKVIYPDEFRIWNGLLERRYSPYYQHLDPLFDLEIVGDFEYFLEQVGGRRPGPEYSIDRVDNSKGYVKGNLRWATHVEQSLNSRKVKLTYNGKSIRQMCLEKGISYDAVRYRIVEGGWTVEQALNTPVQQGNNHLTPRIHD